MPRARIAPGTIRMDAVGQGSPAKREPNSIAPPGAPGNSAGAATAATRHPTRPIHPQVTLDGLPQARGTATGGYSVGCPASRAFMPTPHPPAASQRLAASRQKSKSGALSRCLPAAETSKKRRAPALPTSSPQRWQQRVGGYSAGNKEQLHRDAGGVPAHPLPRRIRNEHSAISDQGIQAQPRNSLRPPCQRPS